MKSRNYDADLGLAKGAVRLGERRADLMELDRRLFSFERGKVVPAASSPPDIVGASACVPTRLLPPGRPRARDFVRPQSGPEAETQLGWAS